MKRLICLLCLLAPVAFASQVRFPVADSLTNPVVRRTVTFIPDHPIQRIGTNIMIQTNVVAKVGTTNSLLPDDYTWRIDGFSEAHRMSVPDTNIVVDAAIASDLVQYTYTTSSNIYLSILGGTVIGDVTFSGKVHGISSSGGLSVTDYGAKGDGVTDDSLAFQTTFTNVYGAAEGPNYGQRGYIWADYLSPIGQVYVPGGAYKVNLDFSWNYGDYYLGRYEQWELSGLVAGSAALYPGNLTNPVVYWHQGHGGFLKNLRIISAYSNTLGGVTMNTNAWVGFKNGTDTGPDPQTFNLHLEHDIFAGFKTNILLQGANEHYLFDVHSSYGDVGVYSTNAWTIVVQGTASQLVENQSEWDHVTISRNRVVGVLDYVAGYGMKKTELTVEGNYGPGLIYDNSAGPGQLHFDGFYDENNNVWTYTNANAFEMKFTGTGGTAYAFDVTIENGWFLVLTNTITPIIIDAPGTYRIKQMKVVGAGDTWCSITSSNVVLETDWPLFHVSTNGAPNQLVYNPTNALPYIPTNGVVPESALAFDAAGKAFASKKLFGLVPQNYDDATPGMVLLSSGAGNKTYWGAVPTPQTWVPFNLTPGTTEAESSGTFWDNSTPQGICFYLTNVSGGVLATNLILSMSSASMTNPTNAIFKLLYGASTNAYPLGKNFWTSPCAYSNLLEFPTYVNTNTRLQVLLPSLALTNGWYTAIAMGENTNATAIRVASFANTVDNTNLPRPWHAWMPLDTLTTGTIWTYVDYFQASPAVQIYGGQWVSDHTVDNSFNASFVAGLSAAGTIAGNGFGLTNLNTTGFTGDFTVLTNGANTATFHITNGLIKSITAP